MSTITIDCRKIDNDYYRLMSQLSSEDLFKGFVKEGMFHEKLSYFFTSEFFYNNYQNKFPCDFDTAKNIFSSKPRKFILHNTMRNVGIPRTATIPNPFAYIHISSFLALNYNSIVLPYIFEQVKNHNYRVSRTHVHKIKNSDSIFQMNYASWKIDSANAIDLFMDKSILVEADISNCFPSIYSHSLPWAGLGKEKAKRNQNTDKNQDIDVFFWNNLDALIRNISFGETDGLPIGPHVSNMISELVLLNIDSKLNKWNYVRHIDDYTCYVNSDEEAQRFLVELRTELSKFNLDINHKKTHLMKLPIQTNETWIEDIRLLMKNILGNNANTSSKITYPETESYLNGLLKIFNQNKNQAILNYGIKSISSFSFSDNALDYFIKIVLHWSLQFSYLVPLLGGLIFEKFHDQISVKTMQNYLNYSFEKGINTINFEQLIFSIYYLAQYGILDNTIQSILLGDKFQSIIFTLEDPILNVILYKYLEYLISQNTVDDNLKQIKKDLKKLAEDKLECIDFFEENWIFAYEILSKTKIKNAYNCKNSCQNNCKERAVFLKMWYQLKNKNITFIKPFYKIEADTPL